MPKRWSTKNLEVVEEPTASRTGVGVFEFTDDYSVFHYGKLPDSIPGKGEAVCRMAVRTFRLVEEAGIPCHFLSFVAPNRMRIRLLRVLDPARGELRAGERNTLIPLQVIVRNMLPEGASVFRRLEAGSARLADFGLSKVPRAGEVLKEPFVEFTTKLEEIDRFITCQEAMDVARLSEAQLEAVRRMALSVNKVVTSHAHRVGLVHADGKVEMGIDGQGELILVDAAGTPDENRFLRNGRHVTKQVMRDFYQRLGLERDVQSWAAEGRPRSSWGSPVSLPQALVKAVSDMYKAVCNLWTEDESIDGPDCDCVIERLEALRRELSNADGSRCNETEDRWN